MKSYTAIILAGGLGSRMGPLTAIVPKPLLDVNGRPIIDYLIAPINNIPQIKELYVTISYRADDFYNHDFGNKCQLVETEDCDNMYCSFIKAASLANCAYFVCLSSDIYITPETFKKCLSIYELQDHDVLVLIKKSRITGHKKWLWHVSPSGILNGIDVAKTKTAFEKYMILLRSDVIKELTHDFTILTGKSDADFVKYSKYNRGWIFMLAKLIGLGIVVRVEFLNDILMNINNANDLFKLRDYLRNNPSH